VALPHEAGVLPTQSIKWIWSFFRELRAWKRGNMVFEDVTGRVGGLRTEYLGREVRGRKWFES
jgi:hypothetical protein